MTEKNFKDSFHLCYIDLFSKLQNGSDAVGQTCQESLLRFLMSGASEVGLKL